ncbi:nucleotide exchange factor GrpE [Actinokineospora sp. G85]|uniref:nucleotide exchange factor GrpE n=1 Tax=Actinokineospora sp. G85 TaxID=3406626 RepID=UPI003C7141B9
MRVADEEAGDGAAILTAIAKLTTEIGQHHRRAEARERVIDNLHAEVERLRVGAQGLLLRPVVIDLQKLRDDLLKQAAEAPDELSGKRVAQLLESYALTVEQTMERCGSVPVRPEPGAPFAPREHRAVQVLPAGSREQDGLVAAVLSDGYLDTASGRVTVPARVHVWKWEEQAETAGDEEAAG